MLILLGRNAYWDITLQSHPDFTSNENTVIAGDFNYNPSIPICREWDRQTYPLFPLLEKSGFRSAYHRNSGEGFGKETSPTIYMYRKENQPFHVDYIFSNQKIKNCQIGRYGYWSKLSDHMPVVATLG